MAAAAGGQARKGAGVTGRDGKDGVWLNGPVPKPRFKLTPRPHISPSQSHRISLFSCALPRPPLPLRCFAVASVLRDRIQLLAFVSFRICVEERGREKPCFCLAFVSRVLVF
ncbi:hypothetical protein BDL97_08G020400 [Sphagnum fallax]|nr:hypothetical protein BDL97_08G020400 [Sphagnum fallax]